MTQQLTIMMKEGFFSTRSGSIFCEFVAYNANSNSLVHITLEFVQLPSGTVRSKGTVESVSLLGITTPHAGAGAGDAMLAVLENFGKINILCGFVYIILVVVFVVQMAKELKQEIYRKMFNE